MFYVYGLSMVSLFFSASYLLTIFSFLALFALGYSHILLIYFGVLVYFFMSIFLFLLCSIYGF